MSEQAGRYQRTFSGLVGAMVVLLAVVLAFVALRALNRADVADPVKAVDYRENLDYFRSQANFPILAPATLPDGWKATSVRFKPSKPQTWHLGILTSGGSYVGIEQGRGGEAAMVDEHVDDEATRGEPVQVRGVDWNTYTDEKGDTALVRRQRGVTSLVVSTLSRAQLVDFVATLR